jgi:hypothetical protein
MPPARDINNQRNCPGPAWGGRCAGATGLVGAESVAGYLGEIGHGADGGAGWQRLAQFRHGSFDGGPAGGEFSP